MTQQVGFGGFSIRELEQKLAGTKLFTYFERDSRHFPGNFAAAWLYRPNVGVAAIELELKALLEPITKPHPVSESKTLIFMDLLYLSQSQTSDSVVIEVESTEWAYWDDPRFKALVELDRRLAEAGFLSRPIPERYAYRPFTKTGI